MQPTSSHHAPDARAHSAGLTVHVDPLPGGGVVVSPAGEIDISNVDQFGAAVDRALRGAPPTVVFDLTELRFIDARGLGILARTCTRLTEQAARMRVIGVSPWMYRVFEIADLAVPLAVERALQRPAGGMRGAGDDGSLVRSIADHAAAATRADVIAHATQELVSIIATVIAPADGVSVSLRRGDSLITCAASDDQATDLDLIQYGARQGPCVDAAASGRQIHSEALLDEGRWPSFRAYARARGIESVLSSPVVVNGEPLGAVNLYSRTAGAFGVGDQELAMLLASQASAIVAPRTQLVVVSDMDARVASALASRDALAQAQGALMERQDVGATEAQAILRRRSVERSTPMHREAAKVLAETQEPSSPPVDRSPR